MQRSQSDRNHSPVRSELAEALAACRGAFYGTALISGMSNILMLTGAMFMLEIYDRVLPSRSMPTLVGLLVLAAACSPRWASSMPSADAFWCASAARSMKRSAAVSTTLDAPALEGWRPQ